MQMAIYEPAKLKQTERQKIRRAYGKGRCPFVMLNGLPCDRGLLYVRKRENMLDPGKLMRSKYCIAHSSDALLDRIGVSRFGGKTGTSGSRANPATKPSKVMRELVEQHVMDFLKPYIEALSAEKEVVVGHGRAARIERVPDHRARMQAAEQLFDRVYGKPKQTQELTGGIDVKPVEVPTDDNRALEVAKILAEAGAVSPIAAAEGVVKRAAGATSN